MVWDDDRNANAKTTGASCDSSNNGFGFGCGGEFTGKGPARSFGGGGGPKGHAFTGVTLARWHGPALAARSSWDLSACPPSAGSAWPLPCGGVGGGGGGAMAARAPGSGPDEEAVVAWIKCSPTATLNKTCDSCMMCDMTDMYDDDDG